MVLVSNYRALKSTEFYVKHWGLWGISQLKSALRGALASAAHLVKEKPHV